MVHFNKYLIVVCLVVSINLIILQLLCTISFDKKHLTSLKDGNNPCHMNDEVRNDAEQWPMESNIEPETLIATTSIHTLLANDFKLASKRQVKKQYQKSIIVKQLHQPLNSTEFIPQCPLQSPLLHGHILVNISEIVDGKNTSWPPTLEELELNYQNILQLGGLYSGPVDCICGSFNAIIVPYRDREKHLRYFLYYIHQILQRQQLCYVVIVSEQDDSDAFNKGQLMNTAFKYARSLKHFDCYIFHDVDIIAEDDRIEYMCRDDAVAHIAPYIDKYNYKLIDILTVGGVIGFTEDQFLILNGYSNEYVGWGGEDDDMKKRILIKEMKVWRSNSTYSRFKMIKHERDSGNPINTNRWNRVEVAEKRQPIDGLNTLDTTIVDEIYYKSHLRLKVTSTKQV